MKKIKVVFKNSKSKKQPYYFVICSRGNGKVLATSETYVRLASAEKTAKLLVGGALFVYDGVE